MLVFDIKLLFICVMVKWFKFIESTWCSETPCSGNKRAEMIIIFNWVTHSWVEIIPFSSSDLSVVVLVSKVGEEFKEGFVFSNGSSNDSWMLVGCIRYSKIRSDKATCSSRIKLVKDSVDATRSILVGASSEKY